MESLPSNAITGANAGDRGAHSPINLLAQGSHEV
jgi:hypothetical protein